MKNRNQTEGYYVQPCPECGFNVPRSTDTDEQLGRCDGCGYHDNDNQFHHSSTKELDFNE